MGKCRHFEGMSGFSFANLVSIPRMGNGRGEVEPKVGRSVECQSPIWGMVGPREDIDEVQPVSIPHMGNGRYRFYCL